jgi:hypothetical protein
MTAPNELDADPLDILTVSRCFLPRCFPRDELLCVREQAHAAVMT